MSKFLSVTHGGHKIYDMNISDTETDALKYLADYIYTNLNPDDKMLAKQAPTPFGVSLIVEGSDTKNVFKWYTDNLVDDKCTFYGNDSGCGSNVVSFVVEIPDDAKFFVFPIGYTENCDVTTIENTDYSNYAFFADYVTAQSNADLMYASASRNLKKKWNDPDTATPYEDTTVRELFVEAESGQDCLLMKVVDLDKDVLGLGTEETTNETTEENADEEVVEIDENEPESTPAPTTPAPTKVVKKVQPLTGTNKKIDTQYLKDWIEQTIDESKVLSGSYKLTMKRTYKASKLNNPNNKAIAFKGLVNPKKYPTKVDYRGYNVKIDISGIVYENIVHIIASDQIIAGVGLESLGNPTADQVFENIFTKAQTNDPKFAGRPVGSLEDTIIHTILVVQTTDKKTTRIVPTDLLPAEKTALEEVIGQENPDYPDRVVFAVNTRFTNEWQDGATIVGAMFVTTDGKFETVGEVNLKTPTVATPVAVNPTPTTNTTTSTTTANQTTSTANVSVAKWTPQELFNEQWTPQDIMNLCQRLGLNNVVSVVNPIDPFSKRDLDGLYSEAIEYAEWRDPTLSEDEYDKNYANNPNYQTFNYTCDVEMTAQSQQPKYWQMSFTVDSATNGILGISFINGSNTTPAPLPPAPVGNLNCVVEIVENADQKKLIGTVNVTLTIDEWKDVRDAYRASKEEEEAVFDRMYCDTLTDAVTNQLNLSKYGSYDFGDIVATDANGNQFKVENPWL